MSRARVVRLEVDWTACKGHGICAELLPERITLDDWGYPVVDPRPVPPELQAHARRAVDACPTLALRARTEVPGPGDGSGPG